MTTQLESTKFNKNTVKVRPAFFDPSTLDWSPWVMDGTAFKLLNINPQTGGFTMLLKVDADNLAPIHGHLGTVEGLIYKGGFGYGPDRGRELHYVLEEGGISHTPDTDEDGMEMFAVVYAPLVGYDDKGGIAGIIDAKMMYGMAVENGMADHLEKPSHWTDI